MITQEKGRKPRKAIPTAPRCDGIPILYEDEGEEDMGESSIHVVTGQILHLCIALHLAAQPRRQVFANMNLYYLPEGPAHPQTGTLPYVSPDVMVVEPVVRLEGDVRSYSIGTDGPRPLLTAETLSQRSAQQRDKEEKVVIYAKLGIPEYILVDVTGSYLPERLLLKRLQSDGTYKDETDADGSVTSHLGFRLTIEDDGQVRVLDAATGKKYPRPREALVQVDALTEEVRVLQQEIERLRNRDGG